jgi:23S rRNA pseudouridine1911/1915/1917 synthase
LSNPNSNQNLNFQFQAFETDIGQRIDRWLTEKIELKDIISTRSYAQSLIEKKCITVNQKIIKSSYQLRLNDIIEIQMPEKKSMGLVPYDFKLDIIFEDDNLIVVNKPAGLVVHPAAGHEQDTLVNALLFHTQNLSMKNEERPGIVHRIDKDTSGLLVIAKNDFTHEHLSQQFKNKTTHRIYYAVTEGTLKKTSGTLQSYLSRHPTDRKRYASKKENNKIINLFVGDVESAKWAVTHFKYLESASGKNLFQLKLETGRTHQIRVHMSENGQTLVGDLMYGYSAQKMKQLNINRFFLHAAELGFVHPKTNENLLFNCPWPDSDLKIMKSWGFTKNV